MNNQYNKIFCILLILSCYGIESWSQKDTLREFYSFNRDIEIKDIEKYPIPLDGNKVKMIPFRVDNLFGFVSNDEAGKWLVQPAFENVYAVYEEGAIVRKEYEYEDDKYYYFGLVTPKDTVVIPVGFDNLHRERKGLYHGLLFHIIDTLLPEYYNSSIYNIYYDGSGKELFREKAHDLKSFNEIDTLAWFRYGMRYNVRGSSGKLWKQFKHDKDREFIGIENNLLIYKEKQEEKFIYKAYDIKDKLVFQVPYDGYLKALVQLAPDFYMYREEGAFGFFDGNGVDKEFGYYHRFPRHPHEYYQSFYQDYYPVQLERKSEMGLINRKGKIILDFEFIKVSEVVDEKAFCIRPVITANNKYKNPVGQLRNLEGEILTDNIGLGENGDLELEYELMLSKPMAFYEGLLVNKDYVVDRIDTLANGKLEYWIGNRQYYIYIGQDRKVKIKLDSTILFAGIFKEGLAPVLISKKGLGFINKKGEIVIDGAYELTVVKGIIPSFIVPEFKGGYAYIKSHNCYINSKGKAFVSYTQKYETEGHWIEVRKEDVKIGIGIPMPDIELILEKTGVAKIKWYSSPHDRYVEGQYQLKDSSLIFNQRNQYKFDNYLRWDNFTIEKQTEKELIIRSNRGASRRRYFLSKDFYDQFTAEEIKSKYSSTALDTLKLQEREKEKAALKELRKNDLSVPEFPGGYKALEKYIRDHLVYPADHSEEKLVKVKFEVDVDGKLLNIKARTNTPNEYSKEAERLVQSMPNWLPYRYNNIAKRTKTYVNIRFKRR